MKSLECSTQSGRILSVSTPVLSSARKKKLHDSLCSGAVDMESVGVARTCQSNKVAFVAVRAIVDNVNDRIPAAATEMIGAKGQMRLLTSALLLAREPSLLPLLVHQGVNFWRALRSLRQLSATLSRQKNT